MQACTTHEDITVFYQSDGIKTHSLLQGQQQRRLGTVLTFDKPTARCADQVGTLL